MFSLFQHKNKMAGQNKNAGIKIVAAIVVMTSFLNCVMSYRISQRNSMEPPCEKCNAMTVHPYIMEKIAPVCGMCGDLFGAGYEHCCICHEYFYEKCVDAFRR